MAACIHTELKRGHTPSQATPLFAMPAPLSSKFHPPQEKKNETSYTISLIPMLIPIRCVCVCVDALCCLALSLGMGTYLPTPRYST